MHRLTNKWHTFWLLALVWAGIVGCSARNAFQVGQLGTSLKESLGLAEPPGRPIQRIEAIWKAAKGHDPKGMPCRGAAGQILFFSAGSEVPVKLAGDGTVVIYIFDNLGKREEQSKPLHRFKFDIGAWNSHLRVGGQLGPTYHVFIPYMRKTIQAAHMSIAVQLIPKRGQMASSELITIALPGPNPKNATKVEVVSKTTRKNVKVSTFKPGEFLNGSQAPQPNNPKKTDAPAKSPGSPQFHDFDLRPRTQVRNLGPVRRSFPALGSLPNNIDKQNEQLQKLMAEIRTQPFQRTSSTAGIGQRSTKLTAAQCHFPTSPTRRNLTSPNVMHAGFEREAVLPAAHPTTGRHPLVDGPVARQPRRDHDIRQAGHSAPADSDPFQHADGAAVDATATQPTARRLLETDTGHDVGPRTPTHPRHPLLDDHAAWPDN